MFLTFRRISIWAAGIVVLGLNPILALIRLVILFLSTACLLIFRGLPLIGFFYVIVYVGAIAVLFLFIIMLLDLRTFVSKNSAVSLKYFRGFIAGFFLRSHIYFDLFPRQENLNLDSIEFGRFFTLSRSLYEDFSLRLLGMAIVLIIILFWRLLLSQQFWDVH